MMSYFYSHYDKKELFPLVYIESMHQRATKKNWIFSFFSEWASKGRNYDIYSDLRVKSFNENLNKSIEKHIVAHGMRQLSSIDYDRQELYKKYMFIGK